VRYQRPLFEHLLKKYEYQYRQRRQYESEDVEYEHRTRKSLKKREDSHDHWHCPFFKHCWNSGMSRLPTVNNCPECGPRKHDPRKVSVFQRIGPIPPQDKRAKPSHEENFERGEDKYHQPRWCPDGLSHSQKRRVQRLRNLEEAEAQYLKMLRKAHPDLAVKVHCTQEKESRPRKKEWHPKLTKADGTASAGTNMVFVLPPEFYAPDRKELPVARLDFGPRPVIFEKPREKNYKHLKALYLKGYINGHPVSNILVDIGAAVNIMSYSVLRRLGRSAEDLIKTNVTLSDFNGQASEAQGVLNVGLTIGSKTILSSFFIVSSKSTYNVLLGRDWIHANCYIPSMMHQCLIQWDSDKVEVVHADDSIKILLADISVWDTEDQEPISGISLEGCDHFEATKNGVRLVLSTGLME
jgi:hypothetical protein